VLVLGEGFERIRTEHNGSLFNVRPVLAVHREEVRGIPRVLVLVPGPLDGLDGAVGLGWVVVPIFVCFFVREGGGFLKKPSWAEVGSVRESKKRGIIRMERSMVRIGEV
jgi:hypothetical protein